MYVVKRTSSLVAKWKRFDSIISTKETRTIYTLYKQQKIKSKQINSFILQKSYDEYDIVVTVSFYWSSNNQKKNRKLIKKKTCVKTLNKYAKTLGTTKHRHKNQWAGKEERWKKVHRNARWNRKRNSNKWIKYHFWLKAAAKNVTFAAFFSKFFSLSACILFSECFVYMLTDVLI